MSARKKRPVLYEVVARSQRTPSWRATPRSQTTQPQPQPPTTTADTDEPASKAGPTEPAVEVAAGKLHLALGWPHLLVLGALLVVIVVGSFQAGVRSAQPASEDSSSLDEILNQPPTPANADDAGNLETSHRPTAVHTPVHEKPAESNSREPTPRPTQPRPTTPESFDFRTGYTYIVIQHLPKSGAGRKAGEQICAFLVSHSVPCTVRVGNSGRDLEVVATEAFLTRQDDSAAARRERQRAAQLQQRIRELGEEYNPIGGYSFEGCYLRTF